MFVLYLERQWYGGLYGACTSSRCKGNRGAADAARAESEASERASFVDGCSITWCTVRYEVYANKSSCGEGEALLHCAGDR